MRSNLSKCAKSKAPASAVLIHSSNPFQRHRCRFHPCNKWGSGRQCVHWWQEFHPFDNIWGFSPVRRLWGRLNCQQRWLLWTILQCHQQSIRQQWKLCLLWSQWQLPLQRYLPSLQLRRLQPLQDSRRMLDLRFQPEVRERQPNLQTVQRQREWVLCRIRCW